MPGPIPTETAPFEARYNPWLGGVLLLLGLLCLGLNLWLMLLEGSFNSGVIVGVIVSVVGFLYLTRPCFVLAPNRLTVYSPIGAVIKRYPFASFKDIQVESNAIYISPAEAVTPGDREKIKLAKWMIRPADWKALQQLSSD